MMERMVNVTCSEIQVPDGFEFRVPDRVRVLQRSDCEHLWYSQDGVLIAHPENPQNLMDPVISVSSDRLVTSRCVDELHHEIYCTDTRLRLETIFRARNETAVTPNSEVLNELTPDSDQYVDQWWWISALIVIVPLVFICFFLRKRIFRCFRRKAQGTSQRKASDSRDLVTVGSDPPGSSVQ